MSKPTNARDKRVRRNLYIKRRKQAIKLASAKAKKKKA